eukprot:363493-Chlamydomonas_euryale.AAC.7
MRTIAIAITVTTTIAITIAITTTATAANGNCCTGLLSTQNRFPHTTRHLRHVQEQHPAQLPPPASYPTPPNPLDPPLPTSAHLEDALPIAAVNDLVHGVVARRVSGHGLKPPGD